MNPADFIEHVSASIAQHPLVALLVAIAGGIFSTSTCPCTLPAVVGIVGYIGSPGGARTAAVADVRARRRHGVALSVAFFVGLMVTLTVLGTIAAVIGRLLTRWSAAFALGAASLTFAAGLATLAGPALRRRIPNPAVRQRGGVLGAFTYGVAYSVATITTSAGPLILLLTVAAAIGQPTYGAVLSLAYGVGRGLPFLAVGIVAGGIATWLERIDRARRVAEIVSGLALLGLSIYFVRLAATS